MKYLLSMSVLLSAAVFAAEPTTAPLPPEEAVAGMRLPQGFRSTLVAAEPDVVQPISYCFDERGRLFVAEALNYGEWQPTGKDRIVILEDQLDEALRLNEELRRSTADSSGAADS